MFPIRKLIIEIINYLDKSVSEPKEREILKTLKNVSLKKENVIFQTPNVPPKDVSFFKALSSIRRKPLIPIREAIIDALPLINWNTDDGTFYDEYSDIGEQYLNGNMNTELIGPKNGNFWSPDCRLGLFLLEPEILYKDHKHAAPELYLNLTNGTYWRFEDKIWTENKAGSIIYNKPFRPHAMKVNKEPFLSIWCWPYNSETKCFIVNR